MANSDLGSIQSLEVDLQFSISSSVTQVSQFKPSVSSATAPQEAQSHEGVISLDQVKELIKDLIKEAKEITAKSEKTEKGVKKFIKELFHDIKELYSDQAEKGKLADIVKSEILNHL